MLRGRYRLAMSLSMLAGPLFDSQWRAPPGTSAGHEAGDGDLRKEEIIRRLGWAGMLRGPGQEEIAARLRDPDPTGDSELAVKLGLLGLDKVLRVGAPWVYGRVPWQAVYNAACLCALPTSSGPPDPGRAESAVRLLRLAVSDPDCELVRPSEWIAMDPDLRALREVASFCEFVREQARWDFAPSPDTGVGDPWFRRHLPSAQADSQEMDAVASSHTQPAPAHESQRAPALVPAPASPLLPGAAQAPSAQPPEQGHSAMNEAAGSSAETKRKARHRVP
jgi:hypothetical protein